MSDIETLINTQLTYIFDKFVYKLAEKEEIVYPYKLQKTVLKCYIWHLFKSCSCYGD